MKINLNALRDLSNDDGMTLKDYRCISYDGGYQVATYGYEVSSPEDAIKIIDKLSGNCGVWYSGGVYYIDMSYHINDYDDAMETGLLNNQQSIYDWKNNCLIWL